MVNGKVPHIVVPTIRSEEHLKEFFKAWEDEFKGCVVHLVFDLPSIPDWFIKWSEDSGPYRITAYSWEDIDEDLGENSWIIPRKSDCVRSYGYWKAWQEDPLFIVTLDDDTKPFADGHIQEFYQRLFHQEYPDNHFYNTLTTNMPFPRGTYGRRKGCDLVHGGWVGVPDLSGVDQARTLSDELSTVEDFNKGLIPRGALFSLCGMNIAWKPEITPLMYFGLQGNIKDYNELEKLPIDRCGDIWCGYRLVKNNISVYTGEPFVRHERASNVWSNVSKEQNAEKMSLELLSNQYGKEFLDYWAILKKAEEKWKGLFTPA